MGKWQMVIAGTGSHHSGAAEDADVLIHDFIEHAEGLGHRITGAHFKVIAPNGDTGEGSFDPLSQPRPAIAAEPDPDAKAAQDELAAADAAAAAAKRDAAEEGASPSTEGFVDDGVKLQFD